MKLFALYFMLTLAFGPTYALGMREDLCVGGRGQELAIQSLRREAYLGISQFPLRAIAAPSLTEDAIDLETHNSTPLAVPLDEVPLICFYRVTLPEYIIDDGMITSGPVALGRSSEWIVAVNSKDESIFQLEGSKDPVGGFNDLTKKLNLNIVDEAGALRLFYFFLKVSSPGQLRSNVLLDDMRLESLALEDFRLRFPSGKSRKAFEDWWKGVAASTRRAIFPPKAVRARDGFEVQYFLYDGGTISKESLLVKGDGTLAQRGPKIISHYWQHELRGDGVSSGEDVQRGQQPDRHHQRVEHGSQL